MRAHYSSIIIMPMAAMVAKKIKKKSKFIERLFLLCAPIYLLLYLKWKVLLLVCVRKRVTSDLGIAWKIMLAKKKVDFYYPTRSTFSIHNAREKCMRARLKTISASYAGL